LVTERIACFAFLLLYALVLVVQGHLQFRHHKRHITDAVGALHNREQRAIFELLQVTNLLVTPEGAQEMVWWMNSFMREPQLRSQFRAPVRH
jgi:hypothetical protein